MRITRAVVPSLFTVLNAFCGFLSIVNSSEGRFFEAAIFIILAGVFDFLDGLMARMTKTSSKFGVELDSLCDAVSFGAAPSFLIYKSYLYNLGTAGIIISSLPLILGVVRLARFNVQLVGFDKDHFVGLPIPHQAITICALYLEYYRGGAGLTGWQAEILAPLTIVLSLLMVSRIRYETFPKFSRRELRQHPWKSIIFIAAGILILFTKTAFIFELVLAFVIYGIIRAFVVWVYRIFKGGESEEDTENQVSSIDF